jgi:pantothenate kinase-related protein Tda10
MSHLPPSDESLDSPSDESLDSPSDSPSDSSITSSIGPWLLAALGTVQDRPLIVGVVGLPGCGKSTWAQSLGALAADAGRSWLAVSLDDFYLEPEARRAAGFAFRGPPGTHDGERLARFLGQVRQGIAGSLSRAVDRPCFDRDAERRLPDQRLVFLPQAPLSLCIIEGWFVGAAAPGYEALSSALDRLIYLDLAEPHARAARLSREAALRQAGRPAMSATEVEAFWAEALSPSFERWVYPLRERADLRITLDRRHQVTALHFRR